MSTLLLVHAHPDDEAVSTGGVIARAHDEGRRVVLVTGTRGELGEVHNMDEESSRPILAEIRTEELREAARILGIDRIEFLGYRDSGMEGTPGNEAAESFHRASLEEASERLAGILREERPDVVVTYGADGVYGHPDHIKAHEVTLAAVHRLREEGWEPQKLYFTAIPRERMRQFIERMREDAGSQGAVGPDGIAIRIPGTPEAEITTWVDVRAYIDRKRAAFAAHVSQNSPESPFQNMAADIYEAAFGTECYVLELDRVNAPQPETGLFDGL
jgi:LmbE family N-acetylglucosaminyl deacetylase